MKILVVSHTYIVDLNREKLRSLVDLDSSIEVRIIVPRRWRPGGVQNQTIETQAIAENRFRLLPVTNFSQNNQALLSFGWEIISILQEFRPQIIQVEQGAKSLGYAQLITLNRLLKLGAKNLFFTWWNLPYQAKLPIRWLEAYNLRHTDGLISGNQDGVDILREHGYDGPYQVIPQLGVDPGRFSPQSRPELGAELGIQAEDFVVGFIGRFVPEKGLLTLMKAIAALESVPWKLLLLGRGPFKATLQQQAIQLGIESQVIWVESVPHGQVPLYLNLMDTLVLPSETTYQVKTLSAVGWKEQFGHVLIEAMACQVPVIGSDSGEIPHVIGDGGLIFPEGEVDALRRCLQTLIENPQLRAQLSKRGYQRVLEHYTNQALARKQLDFYQALLR